MGLSELVTGWFLLTVVVAVVLVFWLGRGSFFKDATAVVSGAPAAWLDEVVLQLSGLTDHRVRFLTPTMLEVAMRRRPPWTILVAVLFFPLGLIALVVTTDDIGTVVAAEEGDLTRVRMRGRFSPLAVGAINRTIPEPTPVRETGTVTR